MRFTVPRSGDARIEDLVAALDRDGMPVAQTWRLVAERANALGLPRPSYANVRRLALAERRRKREAGIALQTTVASLAAGRVPSLDDTVLRLREATAKRVVEPRVSETQGFEGDG